MYNTAHFWAVLGSLAAAIITPLFFLFFAAAGGSRKMSSHDKNFTLTLFTLGFCHVIYYQGDKKVSLPREDRVRKKRKERVEAEKYVENTVSSFKKFENKFF